MPTVALTEAQASLPKLIDQLQPGDPLVITRSGVPVARLLAEPGQSPKPRTPGSAKGLFIIVEEDDKHRMGP